VVLVEIESIFGNFPVLETERLILRKITIDDAEDMFYYGSNEEVSKHVTWYTHQSLSDTKEFIEFILNKYENNELSPWGIELKENGKFIGTIDYVSWQPKHNNAEIGYVISKDYWGMGIMTEAATAVVNFGFEHMDLIRIQARCFIDNLGSERVMKKLGMSFEGIIRKGMYSKEKHQDLKIYSILKEEFAVLNDLSNLTHRKSARI
jgi:ribosomal-protein-alanine N-acetyltransferase